MSGTCFSVEPVLHGFSAKDDQGESSGQLLEELEIYRERDRLRACCNSPFIKNALPESLRKAAGAITAAGGEFNAAVFMLVFASAVALRGRRQVEGEWGVPLPLSLIGVRGCLEETENWPLLDAVRRFFWQYCSAEEVPANRKALPLLYPELSVEACSFAFRNAGCFLSLSPERVEFTPELGNILAGANVGAVDEALTLLSLAPLPALEEFLADGQFASLRNGLLLYVPLPDATGELDFAGAENAIGLLLEPLLGLACANESANRVLALSPEASAIMAHYGKMKRMHMAPMSEEFQDWRKGAPLGALKVAALFQLLTNAASTVVEEEAMHQAVSFMEVMEEHAYHAFHPRHTRQEFACAADIINHMHGRGMTRPEMYRQLDALGYTVEEVGAALEIIGKIRAIRAAGAVSTTSRNVLENNELLLSLPDDYAREEVMGTGVNF